MSSVYFRHRFPVTFGVVLPWGNFFQIILVKSREFYKFTDRLETGIYLSKYIYAVSSVETFNPPLIHSSWILENDCVQIFRIQIFIYCQHLSIYSSDVPVLH